jgi:hypothetical protein
VDFITVLKDLVNDLSSHAKFPYKKLLAHKNCLTNLRPLQITTVHNILLQHPVAHHLLFKSMAQPSDVQHVFLKHIYKFLHITLHISTNTDHHQPFKIVDENCCASVLVVSIFDITMIKTHDTIGRTTHHRGIHKRIDETHIKY